MRRCSVTSQFTNYWIKSFWVLQRKFMRLFVTDPENFGNRRASVPHYMFPMLVKTRLSIRVLRNSFTAIITFFSYDICNNFTSSNIPKTLQHPSLCYSCALNWLQKKPYPSNQFSTEQPISRNQYKTLKDVLIRNYTMARTAIQNLALPTII